METLSREPEWHDGVELVVVAFRSREPLAGLLAALSPAIPLAVVDNSSALEDITDLLRGRPGTRYLDPGENLGFGRACNLAAETSRRPCLIFLNPDARPSPALLRALVEHLRADPECAACGPALVGESGRSQAAGGWQPTLGRALVHALGADRVLSRAGIWYRPAAAGAQEVEWLAGTCLAVEQERFLRAGGFDPEYFLYQEDMDLGRKLGASGARQVVRTDLRLLHAGGASSPLHRREALWTLRAGALRRFLRANHPPAVASAITGILAAGFLLRAAAYQLAGPRGRVREMLTYTRVLRGDAEADEAGCPGPARPRLERA